MKLSLFVVDHASSERIPVYVAEATSQELEATKQWQTYWMSKAAKSMPNKVALRRTDDNELLGLMSYSIDSRMLAVEIIYVESAGHSNANLLRQDGLQKKYNGIAKALFAHAVDISVLEGFNGVLVFKAKTSELVDYYINAFGASHVGSYDPFRLVIWEDAAIELIRDYLEVE